MPRVNYIGGTNVVMRGLEGEDKNVIFCPDENMPFILSEAGFTPPNPKYFISRQRCDHYVLIHIVSGKGVLHYENEVYQLQERDTLIIPPRSKHYYYADPDDPFEFIWLNFFCDYMDGFLSGIGLRDTPLIRDTDCEDQLREVVRIAKISLNNNKLCFPVMHIVHDVFISLAEKVHFEKSQNVYSKLGQKIKELLDESLHGKTDIGEIASALYISKSSVYREFQKYYGVSPYQYILGQKIEIAKSMLTRTNDTVAEIAAHLNFSDQFYFSNLFKKKTGLSPVAFRKYIHENTTPPDDLLTFEAENEKPKKPSRGKTGTRRKSTKPQ